MRLYGTLLSCYVNHKSVQKAESLFSRMKQLGYVQGVWPYNTMLTLYHRMGKLGKLGILLQEMEDKSIGHNTYTLWIRLFWYAANCFVDRMDKVLKLMKDDPLVTMGWNDYAFAADAFLEAGRVDKALALLTTAEQLIHNDQRKIAYEHLLCSYADTVKLDDIGGAEKISEEWESGFKYFDGRVPKLLINVYCRKGLLEEAKSYVQKLVENEKADKGIWLILAHGYRWNGHVLEAVETMRKVTSLPCGLGWEIDHSTLVACLDYLKEKGDVEGAHELLRLLRENGHIRADLCDKIENYIHGETQVESLISGEEGSHMEGVDNIIDVIMGHKKSVAAKYGRRSMKGI
ncbi:hypothetical protein M0R45_009587 [Rubus argutus]|uniref:Pentatricopeptide repeat-containing protein n=1 Tax=Rubus argutus TaxID=59490 RepID=A0AAW1Y530_RUBAR